MLDALNITFVCVLLIFFIFSLWFIWQYVSILKNKSPQKISNVIPSLIDAINKNDKEIIKQVNETKGKLTNMDDMLQNKLNQVETNKRNVTTLFDNVETIEKRVNEDNLRALAVLQSELNGTNEASIKDSIVILEKDWGITTSNLITSIQVQADSNFSEIQNGLDNTYISNYTFSNYSSNSDQRIHLIDSNFTGLSNQTESNTGLIDSNSSNIAILQSSMELTQSNFTGLSNQTESNTGLIDSNSSNIYILQNDMQLTQSNFMGLSNQTESNTDLITSHIDSISSNWSNIENLQNDMNRIESNLTGLSNQTESNTNSISYIYTLSNQIADTYASKSNLELLSNRVNRFESQSYGLIENTALQIADVTPKEGDVTYSNNQLYHVNESLSNVQIPSSLSLTLNDEEGLCLKNTGEPSSCISLSNLGSYLYTKTEYPITS